MDDDNKFSYFFLGLGLGVAAGLLFAPKSGPETRDLLRSKADEGKEYLKRRSAEVRDQAADGHRPRQVDGNTPARQSGGRHGSRQAGLSRSGKRHAERRGTHLIARRGT